MEDEILKIMAAEIAGENVTKEEREKMNRWWEEKRGNERTYKMLMGELGEVVRLVRQQGGLDRGEGLREVGERYPEENDGTEG